jgi:hypothetical protein
MTTVLDGRSLFVALAMNPLQMDVETLTLKE